MKSKLLILFFLSALLISCEKDESISDPISQVKEIEVKSPPDQINYLKNDTLNLSGLRVKVIVNSEYDSIRYVNYSEFSDFNLKCVPDSGDVLLNVGITIVEIIHEPTGIQESQEVRVHNAITDIEENKYRVVEIGTQTWLAENLRTSKYNDNSEIQLIENNSEWANTDTPAYSWYNNDKEYALDNKYGALYNYYVVSTDKLCPSGWHVATENDWQELFDFVSNDGHLNYEAESLRALEVWDWVDDHGTDDYGFTILPSGRRNSYDGGFWGAGSVIDGHYGMYWVDDPFPMSVGFTNYEDKTPSFVGAGKTYGAAVRCVKD